MSMNVILIGDYPPPYGGIAIHIKSLSNEMRKEGIYYEIFKLSSINSLLSYNVRVCSVSQYF